MGTRRLARDRGRPAAGTAHARGSLGIGSVRIGPVAIAPGRLGRGEIRRCARRADERGGNRSNAG